MKRYDAIALKHGFSVDLNEVVNINDVPSGLGCNCVCPSCGEKLVARKGEVNQWHFAHNSNASCAYAEQTAVHLIAKDIIETNGVFLPKVELIKTVGDIPINQYDFIKRKDITKTGQWVVFDSVKLEKKIDNVIPDILAQYRGVIILIEIAVTHFIDKAKLEKLKQLGLPCLEIDANHLRYSNNLENDLKEFLLKSGSRRKWVIPLSHKVLDFNDVVYRINRNKEILFQTNRINEIEREAKYYYRLFKQAELNVAIDGIEIEVKKQDIDCFYFIIYIDSDAAFNIELSSDFYHACHDVGSRYYNGDSDRYVDVEIKQSLFNSFEECKSAAINVVSKEFKSVSVAKYKELEQARKKLSDLQSDFSPEIEVIIDYEI